MAEQRIHRAVSDDGTKIAGKVHGQGPPLVLVPGAMGDGETIWDPLLPSLTDHFTCFALSTRSRGLSARGSDFSTVHLVDDVTAFVDSIGEPVGLMGWSQGGLLALGVARNTTAVSAVAAFEPPVFEVISEDYFASFGDVVARQGELAAEGRLIDAARAFIEYVCIDDEAAEAAAVKFFDILAPNIPVHLQEMEALSASEGVSPTDPSELAMISVPVLLLQGTRSIPWFLDGVRHLVEHVVARHVRTIAGGGHLAPYLAPEAVANELIAFFGATQHSP